ncbi:PAS domain S-box protein [Lysinibacillus composti]|nr:PAS domain S-box protein [Lysinibacillus composti]
MHNQRDSQFFQILIDAIQSLQDIIYIIEVKEKTFTYLFTNSLGASHLNADVEIVGKTFHDVLTKDKADFLHRQYLKAAKFKKVVRFEDTSELDGEDSIYETVLTPMMNDHQQYIIAVVRDVTDRSKKMQELQKSKRLFEKSEKRLTSLLDNNSDAVYMLDTEGYFLEGNDALQQVIGYTPFELVGTHFDQLIPKKELSRVNEYFQRAIDKDNVKYETVAYHKNGQEVIVEVKNIPIEIDGEIIGIYGIAKDITKERATLEELNKIKQQFESFLDDSFDAISLSNVHGRIQFVNEAFLSMFGFTKEELINQMSPIVPDWLKEETNELMQLVKQGKKVQNIHVQRQTKSGEILDLSVTLSPIYNEFNEVVAFSSILRDITVQKKASMEINEIKEELELVWDYSTYAIFMLSQNGSIIKANPAFVEMFSISKEVKNMTLNDFYLDSQITQKYELLTYLKEKKQILQFETKRKRKDGSIIDVLATYRPSDRGEILAIATYKDITKEKKVFNELTESEERNRKILEASPDPLIIHNGKIITYINQAGLELVKAKAANQIVGKPVIDFVHPDYKRQVIERVKDALEKGKRGELAVEAYLTLEGEKILLETTTATFREKGQDFVVVMLRNVTQKQRAEKTLRESEERFRLIVENSRSIIKFLNHKGKIIYASPSMEVTLGYKIRDVIGQSISSTIHPDDTKKAMEILEEIKLSKQSKDVVIQHLHQDGYSILLNTRFIPLITEEGEIEKIIVISDDITEITQKETKLKKMAYYDYLTGLPNRRMFNQRLEQAMMMSNQTGKLTALMVVDCDKFKTINDTLGHDMGDEVIKEFARRIQSSLREKDTVSRVGGDEFTVIIPEALNSLVISDIAKRLVNVMQEPMYIKGHEIRLTASIGVATYLSPTTNVEELFKIADENLYKSKDRGGNTFTM